MSKKWITVSECPPIKTTEYWNTKEEAEKAIERIDIFGCGSQCLVDANKVKNKREYHYIILPSNP